jgi:chromosome segregation ATPase
MRKKLKMKEAKYKNFRPETIAALKDSYETVLKVSSVQDEVIGDLKAKLQAAEVEIQELKRQLAEAQAAASGLPAAIETLRLERDRLSQVNGKLVEALFEAKEFIENLQLDEPEWHSALDSCVIALAEAQKENK